MPKVIVISCTARPGSNTLKVSRIYEAMLLEMGVETELIDLHAIPGDLVKYILEGAKHPAMEEIAKKYIIPNHAFIFVSPEYNGGFPGLLKVFIDSFHPGDWNFKKVLLVGISVGRAGNLRGMEHLTGILNYLKMFVYPVKLPVSLVDRMLGPDGKFNNAEQEKACYEQLKGFVSWLNG